MATETPFTSHDLAETFRDLYRKERSGTLRVRAGGTERSIHFCRGLIHHAESSLAEEGLGACLVRRRLVSTGALAEAQRDTTDSVQLAQSLVNRGLVGKEALRRCVRETVDAVMRAVFAGEGGAFEFHDVEEPAEYFEADVLSTVGCILQAIAATADFEPIREALWALDNRLRLRRPAPVPLERLALTRSQGYLVSRIDGATNLAEIISTLPSEEESAALRFLFGLLTLGVVEYDPPVGDGTFRVTVLLRDHAERLALEAAQERMIRQAYGRMRSQNPHDVLGVTQHASRTSVEHAYEEAKALFSRDRLAPRIRERMRSELGVIESRLVECYLQLTQPERGEHGAESAAQPLEAKRVDVEDLLVRPELDKTRSRVAKDEAGRVGELYYGKARHAMRSADYHNAIQYAKLAISYNADDARFYFLLADCQARNPEARWQRLAEENYTKATQLDPWNADYWISLGRFYKKRGLSLRARRQFEEALKLVPEHEEATRELRALR